eukprot:jgi/Undpi1/5295/HiC_scaffold_2.g00576.m1
MTAQPKPVKVHEVGSGKRLRDQLKLKPVALRAEETTGSRAPKTVPVAENMSLSLCFPQASRRTRTSYAKGLREVLAELSRVLGLERGVGAGGVDSTHADKGISVGLAVEGVGETATKKEEKAASPSAAGAGDTAAAADEMVADDTTAAAEATVAATVAAAVAADFWFLQDEPHR